MSNTLASMWREHDDKGKSEMLIKCAKNGMPLSAQQLEIHESEFDKIAVSANLVGIFVTGVDQAGMRELHASATIIDQLDNYRKRTLKP